VCEKFFYQLKDFLIQDGPPYSLLRFFVVSNSFKELKFDELVRWTCCWLSTF
jgi:hypothetical protein